jgi:hypothetical protein
MVENVVGFFYPNDSTSAARAPLLLDGLPTQSREVIVANMRKSARLTLGILKPLYPWANMDVASEGFVATCIEDEANKLKEDSAVTARKIVEMLPIDTS